ncbi:MAG: F0F1 ATP synthase subunit gamma [Candidatus Omnitrophica bacterium]|nr:F0F1 ATP synthase subunit gamma [Candidatus Omnitrophota bacterium]
MPTSKSFKEQLNFIKSMQSLIEALKDIDAVHYLALTKEKNLHFEYYDQIIKDYVKLFASVADTYGMTHPLLRAKVNIPCVVVLSSDASFMGKLNTELCRTTVQLAESFKTDRYVLVVLGKKGLVRLKSLSGEIISFPSISDKNRYEEVGKLKDFVIEKRMKQEIGELYLVGARSISFVKQEIDVVKLLPPVDLFKERIELKMEKWQEVCVESDFAEIMESLTENWLVTKLYDYAYESKLAQYSARTTHLEGSLDYLKNEVKRVSLQFNKAKRGEGDKAMQETFASLMGA